MSTSAVTPFRSFVQTLIFSVSPSSFGLSNCSNKHHHSDKHHHPADMVVNIIVISSKPSQLCRSISSSISSSSSSIFQYEIAEPYRQKTITAAVINCAREAELHTESCGVALTGSGCGLSGINCSNAQIIPIFSETSVVSLRGAGFQYKPTFSLSLSNFSLANMVINIIFIFTCCPPLHGRRRCSDHESKTRFHANCFNVDF